MEPNIFNDPEKQMKLCAALSTLCLYATFAIMAYLILALWLEEIFPKYFSVKVFWTYVVIIGGSYIIRRIFLDSYKKIEKTSTTTVTTVREDPPAYKDPEK